MTTEYRSSPLTPANFKARRITVSPFQHLLPKDVIGSNSKHEPAPRQMTLRWRHHSIKTDIPTYKGRPRGFFRSRSFSRLVLEDSGAEVGDVFVFEELAPLEFRMHLERPDGSRVS